MSSNFLYVDEDHNDCPMCGGALLVLGQLANRIHYRCRNCGYQCSWKVEIDRSAEYVGTVQ